VGRVDPRGYGARGELIARLARPRNRELFTLVLVGLLTAAGFGAVFAARENEVSTASLSYAAFFFALYLVAHMVLRLTLPDADPSLLPLVATLTAIGEIEIYRIDPELARDQGLWIAIGVALFAGVCAVGRDLRRLESLRYTCGVTALVLLAATLVVGAEVNGARLWIRIGGYQIQPGEFAKVLLVVFLAGYLRDHREVLERPSRTVLRIGIPALRHTLPLLLMSGAALVLLVRMNDLGSSFLLYGTVIAMVYVATGRWLYVAFGVGLFALGAWLAAQVAPQVDERLQAWLDPWKDERDNGFQIVQSLYTIADGGIFGTGLGRGFVVTDSGNTVIPYAQTDFIYSVIATETGFAGAAGLILLYVLFAWRGLKIAAVAGDGFSKLLAVGLTFAFCFQAFVIIGGVTKLVPLTGLTLPFVSYGGSSVTANFALVGLLLCVSQRANRRAL
jgi:cell division protein FtsW (lipid II flippase)